MRTRLSGSKNDKDEEKEVKIKLKGVVDRTGIDLDSEHALRYFLTWFGGGGTRQQCGREIDEIDPEV